MKNKVVDTFNHVLGRKGFDYDQISEGIYIGTNMCCQFGFDKELLQKGVRADISLEEDRVDAPQGVDFFLWLPTKDTYFPSSDKLQLGIQALAFFEARNIPTYVHCRNGHGRAVALYAAFLISRGLKLNEAMNLIKTKRPTMHLHERQVAALEKFQREFKPIMPGA